MSKWVILLLSDSGSQCSGTTANVTWVVLRQPAHVQVATTHLRSHLAGLGGTFTLQRLGGLARRLLGHALGAEYLILAEVRHLSHGPIDDHRGKWGRRGKRAKEGSRVGGEDKQSGCMRGEGWGGNDAHDHEIDDNNNTPCKL